MVITGVAAAMLAMPVTGYLADRGMPLLWMTAGLAVVGTGAVFGAQAVFALDILAASWVMQVGGWATAKRPAGRHPQDSSCQGWV
jgi:hypothetical protein